MVKYRQIAALAAFAALSAAAPIALSAPCAGFVDVDTTNPNQSGFCGSIEWIRNRGVTLGCTAAEYCPDANVTRMQMAAFMTRLGNTLTPLIVTQTANPTPVPLDLDRVDTDQLAHLCKTSTVATAIYPRRAIVYAQFSGLAQGPLQMYGVPTMSVDGANYIYTSSPIVIGMYTSASGAVWSTLTQTAVVDLDPGKTYAFAYLVQRAAEDAGNTNDLASGRCNLTVQIISRTGGASPFDQ